MDPPAAKYRVELWTPEGSRHTLEVPRDETLLEAAGQAGLDLPSSCLAGWCLTCAATLVRGEVDQQDALRYYPQDREEGFLLLCTARPRSDLVLRTHAREAMKRARRARGLPYPHGDWGGDFPSLD